MLVGQVAYQHRRPGKNVGRMRSTPFGYSLT